MGLLMTGTVHSLYVLRQKVMWFGARRFFFWLQRQYGSTAVFDKSLDEYVSFLSVSPGFSLKAVWATISFWGFCLHSRGSEAIHSVVKIFLHFPDVTLEINVCNRKQNWI